MPVRPTLIVGAEDAALLLGGLLAVDMDQMRRAGPNRPRVLDLIKSRRLKYSRYDPDEHWQTYGEMVAGVAKDGVWDGDCEDLATAMAAEMRLGDSELVDPGAWPSVYRTGARMNHVVVESPRYGRLDPSKWAGMGWDESEPDQVGASGGVDLVRCWGTR